MSDKKALLEASESHLAAGSDLLKTMKTSRSSRRNQYGRAAQAGASTNVRSQSSRPHSQQHPLSAEFSTISIDGTRSAEHQARMLLVRAMAGSCQSDTPLQAHADHQLGGPGTSTTQASDPVLALRDQSTRKVETTASNQDSPPRRQNRGPSRLEKDPTGIDPARPKGGLEQNIRHSPTATSTRSSRSRFHDITAPCPPDAEREEHDRHIEVLTDKNWARLYGLSEDDREYVAKISGQRLRRNFDDMCSMRWQAHQRYVQEIPMFSLYQRYNGNPPVQPEAVRTLEIRLDQAQSDLQQGWEDDWRECCTEWKNILDAVAARLAGEDLD